LVGAGRGWAGERVGAGRALAPPRLHVALDQPGGQRGRLAGHLPRPAAAGGAHLARHNVQVALLSAASSAAFLLAALQAGVLVDRARKKRVMVCSDLLRALVIATVPLAQVLGVLTMWQLYAVAFATSVLTVFGYVPHLCCRVTHRKGCSRKQA